MLLCDLSLIVWPYYCIVELITLRTMQYDNPPQSNPTENLPAINAGIIKTASFITKSVNNTFRQRVISLLLCNKQMAVKDLCNQLNTEQSIVSQHLALLRKAGLVHARRQGKSVMYSANERQLREVINCFAYISNI